MSLGLHLRELVQTYLESAIGEDKRKAARMEKFISFERRDQWVYLDTAEN